MLSKMKDKKYNTLFSESTTSIVGGRVDIKESTITLWPDGSQDRPSNIVIYDALTEKSFFYDSDSILYGQTFENKGLTMEIITIESI